MSSELTSTIVTHLPAPIIRFLGRSRLAAVSRITCDPQLAGAPNQIQLDLILADEESARAWEAVNSTIAGILPSEPPCGMSPGERRALFHLVRALKPRRVLEVGTNVGCSTAAIASALASIGGAEEVHLVTVDTVDVNDSIIRPWLSWGTPISPAELLSALGTRDLVSFVTGNSLEYLADSPANFDLVFLDGDHAAAHVYRELPLAFKRLAPGGLIVLHDYCVDYQPYCPSDVVIQGPWLACRRLRAEGCPIEVLPLQQLPWHTRSGHHGTSIALIGRADRQL